MKSYEIAWSGAALRDLAEIRAFIGRDNTRAAAKVAKRILETSQKLTQLPFRGRIGRNENTRELVVPGLPYAMAYRIDDGLVTVLAVLHFARDS